MSALASLSLHGFDFEMISICGNFFCEQGFLLLSLNNLFIPSWKVWRFQRQHEEQAQSSDSEAGLLSSSLGCLKLKSFPVRFANTYLSETTHA